MTHFMNHLAGPFAKMWADLGQPELTPQLKAAIIQGVHEAAAGRSLEDLEKARDQAILSVLAQRAKPAV
jgi:hypothetical protein